MSDPQRHVMYVVTHGHSRHADWGRLRREAAETGALVSAVAVEGTGSIVLLPPSDARSAPADLVAPAPTLPAAAAGWVRVVEIVLGAQAAVGSAIPTDVHVFGDEASAQALRDLVRGADEIRVITHDARPDVPGGVRAPSSTARRASRPVARPGAVAPLVPAARPTRETLPSAPSSTAAAAPARPAVPLPVRTPAPPPPPVATPKPAAAVDRGAIAKAFRTFGLMLGISVPVWFLTPVVASFGSLVIPGLSAAVFAASENGGQSAGDSPVTLYIHLAWVLGLVCVIVLASNLAIGIADRHLWLPQLFTAVGVVAFFWQVIAVGGQLWMWNIAPAAGVCGYFLAQLICRIGRPRR